MSDQRRRLPPQIKRIELQSRSGGRQQIRYQLTVDTGVEIVDGQPRRKQFRKRYATEKEARAALDDIRGDVAAGTYVRPTDITVDQACADWLTSRRLADTSASGYAWILRPVRSELGHLQAQKLARRDVDELVQTLRAGGSDSTTTRTLRDGTVKTTVRKRKPWSARSCNYMLQAFGMVLDQLKDDGRLAVNVVDRVDRVPGDAEKFATYTEEQVATILAAIATDRNRHIWYLALSALRRGEIGGLDWAKDIDFAAETIRIGRRTRVSAGGRVVEKMSGKTENAGRELPLWEPLLGELRAAKARQAAEKLRLGAAYQDIGYVVCNEAGEPYHPDTLSDMWADVPKAAGVPHVRLQDLRHTAATLMLMNGVDPATVSGWLGHANTGFTMKTYVHPQPEAMAKGANALGGIMKPSKANRRAGS